VIIGFPLKFPSQSIGRCHECNYSQPGRGAQGTDQTAVATCCVVCSASLDVLDQTIRPEVRPHPKSSSDLPEHCSGQRRGRDSQRHEMASGAAASHHVEQDLFDGNEDEGDFIVAGGEHDQAESREILFDRVVCCLEEALMELKDSTEAFCRANCEIFDYSGEEKLQYMTIFNEYTERLEAALENALKEKVPELGGLEDVEELLKERPDEVNADVFDVLVSLGDYNEFKSLMLSYKDQVEAESKYKSSSSSSFSRHSHHSERKEEREDEGAFEGFMPPPSPLIVPTAGGGSGGFAAVGSSVGGGGAGKKGQPSGGSLLLAPTVISLGSGAGLAGNGR
jgi:ADP-ribosylation factor-like protein 2-binding protein